MQYDLEPGDFVINPSEKGWGMGQVQSIIKNKATVNFENCGKSNQLRQYRFRKS